MYMNLTVILVGFRNLWNRNKNNFLCVMVYIGKAFDISKEIPEAFAQFFRNSITASNPNCDSG